MHESLGTASLTDGAELTLQVVAGPDARWAPVLGGLLGHKGPVYLGHIRDALREPLDALHTLYYVGTAADAPITVAVVAGAHGAGILAHVYTLPAWRRRGASSALFRALAQDVRARGFRVLTLGTNPEGHARRLYEGMGFRQLVPGGGDMRWEAFPGAHLPDGPPQTGPLRWDDWGWISAAAAAPLAAGEDRPRSRWLGVGGPAHVEAGFLAARQEQRPLQVLRRGAAAIGWAGLSEREAAACGRVSALDFYVRPEYAAEAEGVDALLATLPWPERPVLCALGDPAGYKADALRRNGFSPSAPIPALRGLILWVRPAP